MHGGPSCSPPQVVNSPSPVEEPPGEVPFRIFRNLVNYRLSDWDCQQVVLDNQHNLIIK